MRTLLTPAAVAVAHNALCRLVVETFGVGGAFPFGELDDLVMTHRDLGRLPVVGELDARVGELIRAGCLALVVTAAVERAGAGADPAAADMPPRRLAATRHAIPDHVLTISRTGRAAPSRPYRAPPYALVPVGDRPRYAAIVQALRRGDALVRTGQHWRLARAGDDVPAPLVAALLAHVDRTGRLAPGGDQLPGFPAELAQSWRWRHAAPAGAGR
jgi:hypothetical protein